MWLSQTRSHARNADRDASQGLNTASDNVDANFGKLKMSPRTKTNAKLATTDVLIPEKLYFRIGEVSRLCQLPAYVLRFWETEFPQLKPIKSSTGQRMYRRKDVESVLRIKQLLYQEGFTIPGARQHLRAEIKTDKKQDPLPFPVRPTTDLKYIRQGLKDILTMLSARR
jgi:DNA-binding transcriptional MerR regulator